MTEGETITLVPTITPSDATDKAVRWTTSNQEVATVSDGGLVSALKAGSAVITAKTNDGGLTASCTVTVDIAMAAVTGEASHISCRNAVIAGKVCLPKSTSADLTFGMLYSTNSRVLISSANKIEAKSFDSDFNFTIDTEVLAPETIYYYRSYILQNNEITYGETKSFTTLAVSSMIQTQEATDVDAGVATLNASLNLTDCKYEMLEYGFILIPEGESGATLKADNLSESAFSFKCESLIREKQYVVIAFVTLDGFIYTAESKSFTTQSIKASIVLDQESDITEFKATVSGKVTVESQGQFSKSAKIYYRDTGGTVEELEANGTPCELTLNSDGTFLYTLQPLESGKDYYYVIIATVDDIDFIGEVNHFKTADYSADVNTLEATDVMYSTARLNGTLSVTSIESLTKEVWFLYSETATTVSELKLNGTKRTAVLSENTFSTKISRLKLETTYYFVACAKVHDKIVFGTVNSITTLPAPTPTPVDMGLSVKWGSFNIGATSPEEYGDYYAWGEIATTSNYYWSDYTLCGGSETTMTKYCTKSKYGTVDNKTTLEKVDDVAAQKFGGNWRMPTDAEWTELIINCNWTWTWAGEKNNVKGYMATSRKTGNSIFLPAAGYRIEGNRYGAGTYGDYQSSSLKKDDSRCNLNLHFDTNMPRIEYGFRFSGLSVRPVTD